jgi:hypothetical protein
MTVKTPIEAIPEPIDPYVQDVRYLGEMAELQSLLSRGEIEAARRISGELEGRWPDSDLVRRFARVLAPPVARVVQGGKGISREQTERETTWLREHAPEHLGCWIVLDGDRLIAANPSLRAVLEEADRLGGPEQGSLHYIPRPIVDP